MSYRLINANDLNGKISEEDYKVVLDAPHIFVDLPHTIEMLDGEFIDIRGMMTENCLRVGSGTTAMTIADLVIRECWDNEVLLDVIYFLNCWIQRNSNLNKRAEDTKTFKDTVVINAEVMDKEGATDETTD